MLILSKLITKEWVKSFLAAFFVLFLIITTADIINAFLRDKYTTEQIFYNYLSTMPEFLAKILPVACLMGTLFSINKLKGHSELLAMLAYGMSPKLFFYVIGCCATVVASVQFINLAYLAPKANLLKREVLDSNDLFKKGKFIARSSLDAPQIWYKNKNYFASYLGFDKQRDIIKDMTLFFYSNSFRAQQIIKAGSLQYVDKNIWLMQNGTVLKQLSTPDFQVVESFKEKAIELEEVPSDFKKFESDITTLNFFSLIKFINRLSNSGININEYIILIYEKISLALICIVFALFPLSSLKTPNRRTSSAARSIIFAMTFIVAYWFGYTSILALGNSGKLPPFVASMIIPFIFGIYIIYSYRTQQKL